MSDNQKKQLKWMRQSTNGIYAEMASISSLKELKEAEWELREIFLHSGKFSCMPELYYRGCSSTATLGNGDVKIDAIDKTFNWCKRHVPSAQNVSDADLCLLMQRAGVQCTDLIGWTRSVGAALWFAIHTEDGSLRRNGDAAVWVWGTLSEDYNLSRVAQAVGRSRGVERTGRVCGCKEVHGHSDGKGVEFVRLRAKPNADTLLPMDEDNTFKGRLLKIGICGDYRQIEQELRDWSVQEACWPNGSIDECFGIHSENEDDIISPLLVDECNRLFWKRERVIKCEVINGIEWTYRTGVSDAEIVRAAGATGEITIPSALDGIRVTQIGDFAFENCSSLTEVVIPSGVKYIGLAAFSGCARLTSVVIPSSVEDVDDTAFSHCDALASFVVDLCNPRYSSIDGLLCSKDGAELVRGVNGHVVIPRVVKCIGRGAFADCRMLTSVTIPSSVTIIEDFAFSNCSSLTEVMIPSSVTSIGFDAFRDCSGLTSVVIPSNVMSVGIGAFSGCSGIISVTIPASVKKLSDVFCNDYRIAKVVVLEGVTNIDDDAFAGCRSLTSIVIPSSVKSIGARAFAGCYELKSVIIPEGVTRISYQSFWGCYALMSVVLPLSVTSIDEYAFYNCRSLTSVAMPLGVVGIGEYAFWGCSGLTSVTIPSSVKSIGNSAFSYCSGLTSVTIPSSVKSIGEAAFSECSGLVSVTIPSSVTCIEKYVFYGCTRMASVIIPEGVTCIRESAFDYCGRLMKVVIPSSVECIGESAFAGCSVLTMFGGTDGVNTVEEGFTSGVTSPRFIVDSRNPTYTAINGRLRYKDGVEPL